LSQVTWSEVAVDVIVFIFGCFAGSEVIRDVYFDIDKHYGIAGLK
jgi:hypothetical protein